MLRTLISRRLDAAERDLGAPVDYLRHVARVSLRAFFKFTKFLQFADVRRTLPADVAHVAGLVATLHEDCGTCVRIAVHMAQKDGVPDDVLRAVLARDPSSLPPHLSTAYGFAGSVVRGDDDPALRAALRERHGDEALIELAYLIAAARVFPTVKRALGYATSCAADPVQL